MEAPRPKTRRDRVARERRPPEGEAAVLTAGAFAAKGPRASAASPISELPLRACSRFLRTLRGSSSSLQPESLRLVAACLVAVVPDPTGPYHAQHESASSALLLAPSSSPSDEEEAAAEATHAPSIFSDDGLFVDKVGKHANLERNMMFGFVKRAGGIRRVIYDACASVTLTYLSTYLSPSLLRESTPHSVARPSSARLAPSRRQRSPH